MCVNFQYLGILFSVASSAELLYLYLLGLSIFKGKLYLFFAHKTPILISSNTLNVH